MQLCFGKLNWEQSSDPRVAWWRQCFSEWSLCKERANFLNTSTQKTKKKNRSTCCCLVCVTESASNHRVHVSNACENVQFPLCSFWIGQFSLSLLPTLCLTLHPTDKSSTKQRHVKATRLFFSPIVLSTKPAWRRKTKSSGIAWQRGGRSLPPVLVNQRCPVLVFYDRGAYKGCIWRHKAGLCDWS